MKVHRPDLLFRLFPWRDHAFFRYIMFRVDLLVYDTSTHWLFRKDVVTHEISLYTGGGKQLETI